MQRPGPPGFGERGKFITLSSVKTNQGVDATSRAGYGPLPARPASLRRSHLSSSRAAVLDLLIDQPEPCTVSALSALTRQHPNTIREHLDGLVDAGLTVRTRSSTQRRGRPAWLYSAAAEVGSVPGAREYAGLASALAAQIARTSANPRADSIEAGRDWGRALVRRSEPDIAEGRGVRPETEKVASASSASSPSGASSDKDARRGVVRLLADLGFAPAPDARSAVVMLRRCPLLEAAHQHPEVVCGVHLGVVRGALDELGSGAEQTERTALQAFSEPGACRLVLLSPPGSVG